METVTLCDQWELGHSLCRDACHVDIVELDKSMIQPMVLLWAAAAALHSQSLSNSPYTEYEGNTNTRLYLKRKMQHMSNPDTQVEITCFSINSHWVRMRLFRTWALSFSLLTAYHPVSATVSNSFRDCSHFFYMQTPPAGVGGHSLRTICQMYADKVRYATLYDSSRRLPLYSAYIFQKSDGKRRMDTPWMFEPQVQSELIHSISFV